MKRLLSMITALLLAVFNNIGYQAQGDVPYSDNSYYKLEEYEVPDYRERYGAVPFTTGSEYCLVGFWKTNREELIKYDSSTGAHPSAYWVESGSPKSFSDMASQDADGEGTYTFTKAGWVIIPYAGTITVHSANDCSSYTVQMKIGSDTYNMLVENLLFWWCDVNRSNVSAPDFCHLCQDMYGQVMPAGSVIGAAQEGTTVTITKAGSDSVSWEEFYNH